MFGNIFGQIKNAKPLQKSYANRLPVGTHLLLLELYRPKQSTNPENNVGTILEAEFTVVQSTSEIAKPGETWGWPWFPGMSGQGAAYEKTRAQDFLNKIASSIDSRELPRGRLQDGREVYVNPTTGQPIVGYDGQLKVSTDAAGHPIPADPEVIGELAALHFFRGLRIQSTITPSFNKKTRQPRVDDKGNQYTDPEWTSITQSMAEVATARAGLDQAKPLGKSEPAAAPAPAPAPVVQAAPAPAPAAPAWNMPFPTPAAAAAPMTVAQVVAPATMAAPAPAPGVPGTVPGDFFANLQRRQ